MNEPYITKYQPKDLIDFPTSDDLKNFGKGFIFKNKINTNKKKKYIKKNKF